MNYWYLFKSSVMQKSNMTTVPYPEISFGTAFPWKRLICTNDALYYIKKTTEVI